MGRGKKKITIIRRKLNKKNVSHLWKERKNVSLRIIKKISNIHIFLSEKGVN